MDTVQAFVDENMGGRSKREVLRDATRYTEKGLRAAWFINIIKHYNALPASKSGILRKFLVDQGVDYEIVDNAYGWNERMVVIFNMQKVTKIERVLPTEKLDEFDLPTTFKQSKFLQPKQGMVVFHGTPHDFEEFKTQHVGRGEGYQIYGWGLYFTDTLAVADYYRKSLSDTSSVSQFTWQGRDYKSRSGPESHALSLAYFSGVPTARRIAKEGLADAKAGMPYALEMGGEAYWSRMLEVANAIRSQRDIKVRNGLIYEVDIPADDTYLLWDKPLAAQTPVVQAALASINPQLWKSETKKPATGGDLYRELKASMREEHPNEDDASKAASLYLLSLGVRGIKYLDADSRKRSKGSFNYVVFNDSDVKVLKKAHRSMRAKLVDVPPMLASAITNLLMGDITASLQTPPLLWDRTLVQGRARFTHDVSTLVREHLHSDGVPTSFLSGLVVELQIHLSNLDQITHQGVFAAHLGQITCMLHVPSQHYLSSHLDAVRNDLYLDVVHELVHVIQFLHQGPTVWVAGSSAATDESKAYGAELGEMLYQHHTHHPTITLEEFASYESVNSVLSLLPPTGRRRVLRDLGTLLARLRTSSPPSAPLRNASACSDVRSDALPLRPTSAVLTKKAHRFLTPVLAAPTTVPLEPIVAEFMTFLDPDHRFPAPSVKYVNRANVPWLGLCTSRTVAHTDGVVTGVKSDILIQKGLVVDPGHLRRVVAHEVTHHVAVNEVAVGKPTQQALSDLSALKDAHGEHWQAVIARVNAAFGEGFITQVSDMGTESWETKEVFLFVVEGIGSAQGGLWFTWSPTVTQRLVDLLLNQRDNGHKVYILKTTNRFLVRLNYKAPAWVAPRPGAETAALTQALEEAADKGSNLFATYASGVTKPRQKPEKRWTLILANPKRGDTSGNPVWVNGWAHGGNLSAESMDLLALMRTDAGTGAPLYDVRYLPMKGDEDLIPVLHKFSEGMLVHSPGMQTLKITHPDIQARLRELWDKALISQRVQKVSKFLVHP